MFSIISPLGGVHAVHQYCRAFCRKHELQSSPAVRVHTAGAGRLPGGEKTHTHSIVFCLQQCYKLHLKCKTQTYTIHLVDFQLFTSHNVVIPFLFIIFLLFLFCFVVLYYLLLFLCC